MSARDRLGRAAVLAALAVVTASTTGCGDDEGACKAGEAGCACVTDADAGAACADGLACIEGTCKGESEAGLVVGDKRARACDVLVLEEGARVADVVFGDGVLGTFVREAPRVAVSFIANTDAAISGSAIRVRVNGDISGLSVQEVECAGADGATLSGAKVSLKE